MKLAVVAGQPMEAFVRKGEVKARYYNPGNVFDEVHFLTFAKSDVEPKKIKKTVGNAKAFIHVLGPLSLGQMPAGGRRVKEALLEIRPDVVRSFTPGPKGRLAAEAALAVGVPFVLSLHSNFDDLRDLAKTQGRLGEYARLLFSKVYAERKTVSSADAVIAVYPFIVPYAEKFGAKHVDVIYNKVYPEDFENVHPVLPRDGRTVIGVGRLIPEKDPTPIVQAAAKVGARLIWVGDGPLKDKVLESAAECGCHWVHRASVPNEKLPGYYASADVYAQNLSIGGVSIPTLEAMAAGLPVVVSAPKKYPRPDLVAKAGVVVEGSPAGFAHAFSELFSDAARRKKRGRASRKTLQEINGHHMEACEASVYRRVLAQRGMGVRKPRRGGKPF
ncbi:glycosyltransferase [Candidatus Micrarchaeota archaeon]|nr:glycosyltransferase [Candidatus Micrarchaeota archaeon]